MLLHHSQVLQVAPTTGHYESEFDRRDEYLQTHYQKLTIELLDSWTTEQEDSFQLQLNVL